MLESILNELNNWFVVPGGHHFGTFSVQDGGIALPFLRSGQYYRILGSVFNDGLHQYGRDEILTDETFTGAVWALAVPKAVQDLADEIGAWQQKNGDVVAGPYQSESFGGYTYTRATDAATGGAATWESAFRRRLDEWRKIK